MESRRKSKHSSGKFKRKAMANVGRNLEDNGVFNFIG
jgi:hypothetical protein